MSFKTAAMGTFVCSVGDSWGAFVRFYRVGLDIALSCRSRKNYGVICGLRGMMYKLDKVEGCSPMRQ